MPVIQGSTSASNSNTDNAEIIAELASVRGPYQARLREAADKRGLSLNEYLDRVPDHIGHCRTDAERELGEEFFGLRDPYVARVVELAKQRGMEFGKYLETGAPEDYPPCTCPAERRPAYNAELDALIDAGIDAEFDKQWSKFTAAMSKVLSRFGIEDHDLSDDFHDEIFDRAYGKVCHRSHDKAWLRATRKAWGRARPTCLACYEFAQENIEKNALEAGGRS